MLGYNYNKVQFTYRNNQLKDYGFDSYQDFLLSPFWKGMKERLKQKEFFQKCSCCGSKEGIELHHMTYKDMMDWTSNRNIIATCRDCHQKIHDLSREKNITFKNGARKVRKANSYKSDNRPSLKVKKQKSNIPKEKKEKLTKYIVIGEGKTCPKCRKFMQRRGHKEIPTSKVWFEQWDYCKPCGHVQHYAQYKRQSI
jgi:hypothetical protein